MGDGVKTFAKVAVAVVVGQILIYAALVGGVIYVAHHFIAKYW